MDYSSVTHVPWEEQLLNHTVLLVGNVPVFTLHEVTVELEKYDVMDYESVTIQVAPHHPDEILQTDTIPLISTNQLCAIHILLYGKDHTQDFPVLLVTEQNASTMAGQWKVTRKKCLLGPEASE